MRLTNGCQLLLLVSNLLCLQVKASYKLGEELKKAAKKPAAKKPAVKKAKDKKVQYT